MQAVFKKPGLTIFMAGLVFSQICGKPAMRARSRYDCRFTIIGQSSVGAGSVPTQTKGASTCRAE
jgi:hypothetical protein